MFSSLNNLGPGLKIAGVTNEESCCSDRKKQQFFNPSSRGWKRCSFFLGSFIFMFLFYVFNFFLFQGQ